MEEHLLRYQSESSAQSLLQQLINETHRLAYQQQLQKKIKKHLPDNYLGYMRKVSAVINIHKQPKGPEYVQPTVMTEPNEAPSYMHRPLPHNDFTLQDCILTHKQSQKSSKLARNNSVRFSSLSRTSQQQPPSRKHIYSRRIITSSSKKHIKM